MSHKLLQVVAIVGLLSVAIAVPAMAESPYTVRLIEPFSWIQDGLVNDTVVIVAGEEGRIGLWIEPGSGPDGMIGGFEFLLSYPKSQLTFMNAYPSADLHEAWEYFTWRAASQFGDTCSVCPSGVLRLVGIADMNDAEFPPEETFHLSGCIIEMSFVATGDPAWHGECIEAGFCTIECGDNAVASRDVQTLYIPASGTLECPEYSLAACTTGTGGAVVPYLNFHAGTICIAPPPNHHGDINLNGLQNEIGDLVLFANFLNYGWAVLTPPFDTVQFINMEIDCDGTPGTTADFVYMMAIITGQQQPIPDCQDPAFPPDTTWASPESSAEDTIRVLDQFGAAGDTIAVDVYLRNVDTVGAFNFRLLYDAAALEPITDTILSLNGDVYRTETELLRGTSVFDWYGGSAMESGVTVFFAAAFDASAPPHLTAGAGATVRTWWRIRPGTPAGNSPLQLVNDPVWPQSYNTISDITGLIWKRPVLEDGIVTIINDGCSCPDQLDFDYNDQLDALDLNVLIDVVFGWADPGAPDPGCPGQQADFDYNGFPDALDLNLMIDHLFFTGPGPCDPCNPDGEACTP